MYNSIIRFTPQDRWNLPPGWEPLDYTLESAVSKFFSKYMIFSHEKKLNSLSAWYLWICTKLVDFLRFGALFMYRLPRDWAPLLLTEHSHAPVAWIFARNWFRWWGNTTFGSLFHESVAVFFHNAKRNSPPLNNYSSRFFARWTKNRQFHLKRTVVCLLQKSSVLLQEQSLAVTDGRMWKNKIRTTFSCHVYLTAWRW